ncbi:neuritin [Nerophis lumbriciformis]|uniref:neuritin n=1 Tax=Nerophis lumbriciformis TaxID=546530 RepID=UPI002ADF6AE6|nr:neuritin-like [Nerophis lumbriciformis]XP_061821000.1 neuritin-like [Nerophis lumbriciformis]
METSYLQENRCSFLILPPEGSRDWQVPAVAEARAPGCTHLLACLCVECTRAPSAAAAAAARLLLRDSMRMGGGSLVLVLALHFVWLLHSVLVSSAHCDAVFKGLSDCVLQLGDNMANYPQDLDEQQKLHKICNYWDDFHSCASTALADCQEGATELWEKLKKESRNLDFRGNLYQLCGGNNGAPGRGVSGGLGVLLAALPSVLTWLAL